MSQLYQTVIYNKERGEIVKVLPNQYISSKRQLARFGGREHWSDLAFMYFAHDLVIDPGRHKVRSLSSNSPPCLVSSTGVPIEFDVIIQERRSVLASGVKCLVEFEGGMGDQLMEAAAVLKAMKKYPKSSFSIRCSDDYLGIVRRVTGIPQVENSYVGASKAAFDFTVSNHTNYISDPRGGKYGKASLYGAWLGLPEVSKVVKIKLSAADYQAEHSFLDIVSGSLGKLNVMCQFRSGSGHAKSWQGEKVVKLAELFKSAYECNFFVVGRKNELPGGLSHINDLTGGSSWWQTCLLVSQMDVVICIDSGVMHLARSLSRPYIALWGGTNAQMILGDDEQDLDIRLPLDCYDRVCYDCQNKTNACMTQITPDMVFHNAQILLNNSSKGFSRT